MYICYFWLSTLVNGCGPSYEQTWIPFNQKCSVQSLVEIGPVVLGKKIFLILPMYFCYFIIISPYDRAWPFIWTKLNPLHQGMLCAKFGWNWPSGFGEEDENVISLQMDGQTYRWSEKLTWAFIQLRWANKNLIISIATLILKDEFLQIKIFGCQL